VSAFIDTVTRQGAVQRMPSADRAGALLHRRRHGVAVLVLPTRALSTQERLGILRYRLAQYLLLGFFDSSVVEREGMEHEPPTVVTEDDIHLVAGDERSGQILCYATLRAVVVADAARLMRDVERPLFPVERAFGRAVYQRLTDLGDLPVATVREFGRFVKNQAVDKLDERLIRAAAEVGLALAQVLCGRLRHEVRALVGGLEEHVVKRTFDVLQFPAVTVHGAVPIVSESSYTWPLYVRRQAFPFAVLCTDVERAAPARVEQLDRALALPGRKGLRALLALRTTAAAPNSSLQPPGGLPRLADTAVDYQDMPMRRRNAIRAESERLRTAKPLGGLSEAEATVLRTLMTRREVDADEAIVRQGEFGDSLFIIESGRAEVSVRGRDGVARWTMTLYPGDHFGEIGLLTGGERAADVVATTPMTLLELTKNTYDRYLADFPDVAERLQTSADERLQSGRRDRGRDRAVSRPTA
jgi:CRP-like cAMP-binding protein